MVRQVYIVQKISPGDLIHHKIKMRVRFFLGHPLANSSDMIMNTLLVFWLYYYSNVLQVSVLSKECKKVEGQKSKTSFEGEEQW